MEGNFNRREREIVAGNLNRGVGGKWGEYKQKCVGENVGGFKERKFK